MRTQLPNALCVATGSAGGPDAQQVRVLDATEGFVAVESLARLEFPFELLRSTPAEATSAARATC